MLLRGEIIDIADTRASIVLNQDGIIQIEDSIYKITVDQIYRLHEDLADLLGNNEELNASSAVAIHPSPESTRKTITDTNAHAQRTTAPGSAIGCNFIAASGDVNLPGIARLFRYTNKSGATLPTHNGRTTRAVFTIWRENLWFYSSIGARVKMQKHTAAAGWQSNINANQLILEACFRGRIGNGSYQNWSTSAWPYFTNYGDNRLQTTLSSVGFSTYSLSDINYHAWINYAGNEIEQYIQL